MIDISIAETGIDFRALVGTEKLWVNKLDKPALLGVMLPSVKLSVRRIESPF